MNLGQIGIWRLRHLGIDGVAEIEQLGYSALWLGGSPSTDDARPYLEATSAMTIATGILNVWQHEPAAAADGYAKLDADFPGRFLLGIGIGHPEATSDYKHPLATMRAFFDGLDAVPTDRRMAAALGPKMLDLAAQRSLGAHTYFVPPEHAKVARERMGAGRRDRHRGRVRGRDRREHRTPDRSRVREGLPRPPQLREQPRAARLRRKTTCRTAAATD